MPQLGRQNLAACCDELGIVREDEGTYHSALFDAHATAKIVARLLAEDPSLLSLPERPVESSKGRKARQYGTRIVAEAAFWRMLGIAVE